MQFRSLLATLVAATLTAGASFLSVPAWAMSQKPKVTVRFHSEANAQDGSSFARPVTLKYHKRNAFLNQAPDLSEKNIVSILPFRAADGTWGCTLQLDEQGRLRLETSSSQSLGRAMVVFIGTKTGIHQVVDLAIDRQVTDGIVSIPLGITEGEMFVLRQQFPVMGEDKKKKKDKPEKTEAQPSELADPNRPDPRYAAPAPKPPKRSKPGPAGAEPELPRLAD